MKTFEVTLVKGLMKNYILVILRSYHQIILLPVFLFIAFSVFLYKFVYLEYKDTFLNPAMPLLFQYISFFIMILPGISLFIPAISMLSNAIFHPLIRKNFHYPLNPEKLFFYIEKYILLVFFPFLLIYIFCITYALSFSFAKYLLMVGPILLIILLSTFINNRIVLFATTIFASKLSWLKVQDNYYLFLFNFIITGFVIMSFKWIHINLEERASMTCVFLLLLLGFSILLKDKFISWYNMEYLVRKIPRRRKKVKKQMPIITDMLNFEFMLIRRHIRLYTDFYGLAIVIILLMKFLFNQQIDITLLTITLSTLVAPLSLAIRQYFQDDLKRYPHKKELIIFSHYLLSFLITSSMFMLLTLITNDFIRGTDLLAWIYVFITLMFLQLIFKVKFHHNQSSLYFILFGLCAQLLTIGFLKFQSLYIPFLIIILLAYLIYGGVTISRVYSKKI
ncbi:hypothetical protein AB1K09_01005 [Solibacillus silvestris]